MSYTGGGPYYAQQYPEYNGILWNGRCGNPECIYHWHPPEDAPGGAFPQGGQLRMMKLFRVHHVHANGLETLALTVSAGGLKSAVKRVREHPLIRLPNGTYYIFEAGNYSDGLQITFS